MKLLNWVKRVFLERGTAVVALNRPAYRGSLRRIMAREKPEKIRILFLLQNTQIWPTLKPIYEAALKDPEIEATVIAVPELRFRMYIRLEEILWQGVYDFAEKNLPAGWKKAYDPETGCWLNPREERPDYVFYPRPYETYWTRPYRASAVRKYARVCYASYGFSLKNDYGTTFNTHFMRNVYACFCDTKRAVAYVKDKLGATARSGEQLVIESGCSRFDLIREPVKAESPAWPRERAEDRFRVIWTPRWTVDPKLQGSNFFSYKDDMITWAERETGMDLVFRPHPMALKHYVDACLMTREELDGYLGRYTAAENAAVDRRTGYFDTFWSSDVLISDYSSVMADYYLTGKPLIYCPSGETDEFMVDGFADSLYIVRNFREMKETVDMLRAGNDPKKEARDKLIPELKKDGKISEGILKFLKEHI